MARGLGRRRTLSQHVQMARDLQQHGAESGPGQGTDVKPAQLEEEAEPGLRYRRVTHMACSDR
jgi:hypothetical protein